MFSLANNTTIVGTVAPVVAEFAARWVQSPSGYDFLVASTVPVDWARAHMPVISTDGQHHMYTKFMFEEPWGKFIVCPAGHQGNFKTNSRATTWRVICKECGARGNVPRVELNSQTPLGRKGIVKAKFPQEQHAVAWVLAPTTETEGTPPRPSCLRPGSTAGVDRAPSPSTSTTVAPPRKQTPVAPVRPRGRGEIAHTASLPAPPGPGLGPPASGSSKLMIRVPPRNSKTAISQKKTGSTPSKADNGTSQRKKSDSRDPGGACKRQKTG